MIIIEPKSFFQRAYHKSWCSFHDQSYVYFKQTHETCPHPRCLWSVPLVTAKPYYVNVIDGLINVLGNSRLKHERERQKRRPTSMYHINGLFDQTPWVFVKWEQIIWYEQDKIFWKYIYIYTTLHEVKKAKLKQKQAKTIQDLCSMIIQYYIKNFFYSHFCIFIVHFINVIDCVIFLKKIK